MGVMKIAAEPSCGGNCARRGIVHLYSLDNRPGTSARNYAPSTADCLQQIGLESRHCLIVLLNQ